jgi:hypothetical protein
MPYPEFVDYRQLRRGATAALLLEKRREDLDRARGEQSQVSGDDARHQAEKVRYATASTYRWLTEYTKTNNPHWKEQKRSSAYEPFPEWPFMPVVLEYLERDDEKIKLIEKSRTMMVTWACMGYFTLQAMLVPEREIVCQTMTDEKVEQLIDYAKQLYTSQPSWLQAAFPCPKPVDKQPKNAFYVGSSVIFGIAGGKGKIRSYHPWAYFNDETAFQPEAGECYDEALSACQKIVLNSTAAPGWYFDFLADATVKQE